jgi:hypothetical protein
MSNPYASPESMPGPNDSGSDRTQGRTLGDVGMVRQVVVVAILMIVQGSLEVVVGIFLLVMAAVMPGVLMNQPGAFGGQGPGAPDAKTIATIATAMYAGMGAVALAVGALKIFAGIRNLKYRGRILGIVALVSGVASMLTCYCLPTGLALLIYGLIVHLNADVARAFQLGQEGYTPDQIKASPSVTPAPFR